MTAQESPRAIFNRAVERKSLMLAMATAREIGVVSLEEALSLVALVAELQPERLDAFGRRWLARLATERSLTLGELDLAITALRVLPSDPAVETLRQLAR